MTQILHPITDRLKAASHFALCLLMSALLAAPMPASAEDFSQGALDQVIFKGHPIGIYTDDNYTDYGATRLADLPTIDLTHISNRQEALATLAAITRHEHAFLNQDETPHEATIDTKTITYSKRSASSPAHGGSDASELDDVDRMIDQINRLLDDIEKSDKALDDRTLPAAGSNEKHLDQPLLETDPAAIEPQSATDRLETAQPDAAGPTEIEAPETSRLIPPSQEPAVTAPESDPSLSDDLLAFAKKHAKPSEANLSATPPTRVAALTTAPAAASKKRNGSLADKINVGDVLALTMPGEEALTGSFAVSRSGDILLPEVGAVPVADMTIEDAAETIRTELAVAYRNLDRLTVEIKDHQLFITVLGFVKTPGQVQLSAEGNIQTAISEAGGLAPGAQLDRVQLRRGEEVVTFDYKAYLNSGDIGILPPLKPLDVVFVPASPLTGSVEIPFTADNLALQGGGNHSQANTIRVFGEVAAPGAYAPKPGQTIVDILLEAGGLTKEASVRNIRVLSEGEPVELDLNRYLETGDATLLPVVPPAATIVVPRTQNAARTGASSSQVHILGEVVRPGSVAVDGPVSFISAVSDAGGPTAFANAALIRVVGEEGAVTLVDLPAFTAGNGKPLPTLNPGDTVFFPRKSETATGDSWLNVASRSAVEVIGAVGRPDRYEWSDDMSFFDLIAEAGGPASDADITNIQILAKENGRTRPFTFNMERFIANGGAAEQLPVIRAGYVVHIPRRAARPADNKSNWITQPQDQSIYVFGKVASPGRYAFSRDLNFLDIISAAGGPDTTADLRKIRVTHRGNGGSAVRMIDLSRYFETGEEHLLPRVVPGDVIYVPSTERDWLDQSVAETVRVLGAVKAPGRYRFQAEMSILDLLAEAGGPNPTSLSKKILIVNRNDGPEKAQVFNLVKFAKTGDPGLLPVVRPGDTVYVPDRSQSVLARIQSGVAGSAGLLTLALALAAL
ncbi:MAG: SLBB domain-containing protein [Rhizobiales bacterium]|nr:SLBB domain-containing protein [Hyphomicrobiales bacterium]